MKATGRRQKVEGGRWKSGDQDGETKGVLSSSFSSAPSTSASDLPPSAFTLIELLVVLAVMGVLAAVCVPVFGRMAETGRAAKCVSNLRQLGSALGLYLGEHNMAMPTLLSGRTDLTQQGAYIDNTFNVYTEGNAGVFACPSDKGEATRSGTSYYWNVALNGQSMAGLNFLKNYDQTQVIILADKAAYHPYLANKVNFLYADGHAEKDFSWKFQVQP